MNNSLILKNVSKVFKTGSIFQKKKFIAVNNASCPTEVKLISVVPWIYPIPLLVIVIPVTLPAFSPSTSIVAFATAPNPWPCMLTSGAVVYPLPAEIIAIDIIRPLLTIACATAPLPDDRVTVGLDV